MFRWLAPPGRRGRLVIFIFHRVLPVPDALFPDLPDVARFDEILGWIESWFNVVPLDRAVRDLEAGTLPARAAAITFDDGYADNLSVAVPLLLRHRMTATFFIATAFLDGGRMWNDTVIESIRHASDAVLDLSPLALGRHSLATAAEKRAAIETLIGQAKYLPIEERLELTERIAATARVEPSTSLMLTSDALREMRRVGMQIGAHTVSHPILARLSSEEARREMADGRERLQQILGERIGLFAYPNGRFGDDYLGEHAAMAKNLGFDAAFATDWGVADCGSDLMRLPRFTPWDRRRVKFGARLALNLARSRRLETRAT